MRNLNEGLKERDLEDLVLPLISIDEYESKLDDDSVVLGFHVIDRDPAQDLNRFIQKGPVDILDTDVSPAPNEDGQYLVFVEIMRNEQAPDVMVSILQSLRGLTGLDQWEVMAYGVEETFMASVDAIRENVRLVPMEEEEELEDFDLDVDAVEIEPEVEENINEEVLQFLESSGATKIGFDGTQVSIYGKDQKYVMEFVELVNFNEVDYLTGGIKMDGESLREAKSISALMGPGVWECSHIDSYVVLEHVDSDKILILKK